MNFISARSPRTFLSFIFDIFSFFIHSTPEQKRRHSWEKANGALSFFCKVLERRKEEIFGKKWDRFPKWNVLVANVPIGKGTNSFVPIGATIMTRLQPLRFADLAEAGERFAISI